jgi:hypothetical protein
MRLGPERLPAGDSGRRSGDGGREPVGDEAPLVRAPAQQELSVGLHRDGKLQKHNATKREASNMRQSTLIRQSVILTCEKAQLGHMLLLCTLHVAAIMK